MQRRILYTMHELGNTADKPHRKCARIVGDCLGKFHPHGDTSVYDALARMAQPFVMRSALVDGHGNFGSIDGDSPAAMRYTEARMTELAQVLLQDIDKDTVASISTLTTPRKSRTCCPALSQPVGQWRQRHCRGPGYKYCPPHNIGEVISASVAQLKTRTSPPKN